MRSAGCFLHRALVVTHLSPVSSDGARNFISATKTHRSELSAGTSSARPRLTRPPPSPLISPPFPVFLTFSSLFPLSSRVFLTLSLSPSFFPWFLPSLCFWSYSTLLSNLPLVCCFLVCVYPSSFFSPLFPFCFIISLFLNFCSFAGFSFLNR